MGKLLVYSMLAMGHQCSGIMLSQHLLAKYGNTHQVYMAVDQVWKERLQSQFPQFHYKVYQNPFDLEDMSKDSEKDTMILLAKLIGYFCGQSPSDQIKQICPLFVNFSKNIPQVEVEMKQILNEVKPDLIVSDLMAPFPFIIKSGIPWAVLISANPLLFHTDQLPPAFSGLRVSEQNKWSKFTDLRNQVLQGHFEMIQKWLQKYNCRPLQSGHFFYESPYFNIYCYPKPVDYFELEKVVLPGRWFRLEAPISPREKLTKIELPLQFKKLPGKLIYFSFGSTFSAYTPLMQRLLDLMEQIPHKFVVSKGPFGDDLRMPANCWGKNFVNQKAVLNSVDLFITHGGNNSFNESFHFGVPMIILPLFVDQHDNATRIEETGFGARLAPFDCTKEQLHQAIDSTLNNQSLIQKLKENALRTQLDNGTEAIIDEIAFFLNKPKPSL